MNKNVGKKIKKGKHRRFESVKKMAHKRLTKQIYNRMWMDIDTEEYQDWQTDQIDRVLSEVGVKSSQRVYLYKESNECEGS